ncbi:PIG-L family deacetylase [Kocuria sp.]|uniref:PIG-L family deacetylase n=1 Tax=Kocuria sp. TaxID=1871328 RepID=UPI0026E07EE6|nr:PIG-L family deacetylase [Kocuria sp.]MDO5367205.1 PIG-L family deacetylase [Kocuria sp.]
MSTPRYPGAGTVTEGAVDSLLPAGRAPGDARILWVHAHPDDESIATGGSIAHYAHAGATNVLLTMTRGERGEVIPEPLRHLEVGQPGCPDTDGTALGLYRVGELDDAAAALGLSDRFFAGETPAVDESVGFANGLGRYLDSGMSWGDNGRAQPAEDVSSAALTSATEGEAAAHVAAAIRAVRPHAVVTYCDDGGYGHPDHVRTHHVTVLGVDQAMTPARGARAWDVALVWGTEGESDPADQRQQAVIDGHLGAKRSAMAAHATQIVLPDDDPGTFELSNGVPQALTATEHYRLLRGELPGGESA